MQSFSAPNGGDDSQNHAETILNMNRPRERSGLSECEEFHLNESDFCKGDPDLK